MPVNITYVLASIVLEFSRKLPYVLASVIFKFCRKPPFSGMISQVKFILLYTAAVYYSSENITLGE